MQTWRLAELLLEVTITGSHAGSPVRREVRHWLVNAFLWQLFSDGLQGDFQLTSRLRLRLD